MVRYRIMISLTLSLGLLLGGCALGRTNAPASSGVPGAPQRGAIEEGISTGNRLPDVEFMTFAGDPIRLKEMVGQPLIVNFWATWCGPCKQEIPLLQDAFDKHQSDGLKLIAITDEDKSVVEPFVQNQGMTFPIMFDKSGRASNKYGIQGIPTTFFLDRDGVIIARHVGALGPNVLQSYLDDLLQQPTNAPAPTDAPAEPAPTNAPVPTRPAPPTVVPLPQQIGMATR